MNVRAQILDATYGKAATGVRARLTRAGDSDWITVGNAETNSDGCIEDWQDRTLPSGLYRIICDSKSYFAMLGGMPMYMEVALLFRITDEPITLHVLLILSPNFYSVYIGRQQDWQQGRN
jgi:5-hydroxyisourate hydrolase